MNHDTPIIQGFRTISAVQEIWKAACHAVIFFVGLFTVAPAFAQLTTVPMKGVDNVWVKQLSLKGTMDWEWIETYPEQVYFATRHEHERHGDIVSMWTRLEYKYSQRPLQHRSALSRDDWDCGNRRRSTKKLVYFKFNNLEDQSPVSSTIPLPSWESIEAGTIGETLLNFACGIQSAPPTSPEQP